MPSPFPGMDPYLETPDLWPDVHHELISEIRSQLNPKLRPHYVARVELRVYISDEDDPGREAIIPDARIDKPNRNGGKRAKVDSAMATAEPLIVPLLIDDEIEEARIEIKYVKTGALVTLIEVMSPTNKIRNARGRESFMKKLAETLASDVHWVEIDLLRAGLPSVTRPPLRKSDYRVLVSKAHEQHKARYWPINIRQPLPVVPIPLRSPDADVPLDLHAVVRTAYDRGAYDVSIDYGQDCSPPLTGTDASWANRLLRQQGLL